MSINLDFHTPKQPLREAILNSIAHKDYSSANPIQISVYSDKIIFWEKGQLPENWTISQDLLIPGKRQSRLQLSQLEVFSRCLNAKSETISRFEDQITITLQIVTQYLSRSSKISFVLNLGFGTFVLVSNFVLRI